MSLEHGNDSLAIIRQKLPRELDSSVVLRSAREHHGVDYAKNGEHEFEKATKRFGGFEFCCACQISSVPYMAPTIEAIAGCEKYGKLTKTDIRIRREELRVSNRLEEAGVQDL